LLVKALYLGGEKCAGTRERYVLAIDSVADYLEIIEADLVWVERFDDLSGAS